MLWWLLLLKENQLEIIGKLSEDKETLKQSIMWYENLISSKVDGLAPLLSLFKSETEFIEHFFKSVEFFNPEVVKKRSIDFLKKKENGEPLPVRYSMKTAEYFRYLNKAVNKGWSKKSFKNKEDAIKFALNNDFIHFDTKIKVCIDKDGNYFVRNEIYDAIGYRVSQGAISDVKNYVISHIWGKTENPLFFTSLWNIVIVPNHLAFILDKPDENSEIVRKIKMKAKSICYLLYDLENLFDSEYLLSLKINKDEFSNEEKFAKDYLEKNRLNYLKNADYQADNNIQKTEDPYDILEDLRTIIDKNIDKNKDKNKEFIFATLDKLKTSNTEFINLFVDQKVTKNICKLSYPILVEITGDSRKVVKQKIRPVKSFVYYSKDYFEFNSELYLVCNDWHTINKEMLLEWLTGINE